MKRFLSMVLALALVLTSLMVPAYANEEAGGTVVETPEVETPVVETVEVDITSISDGDTFAAGANIALAADASTLAEVKNIDFYANGAKLPGTIVGSTGSVIWYGAAEGAYDITTKVTYTGGATAWGNETVGVIVKPADESKIKLLWPSEGMNWKKTGGGSYKETDKYAMFDNKALEIIPKGNTVGTLFTSDEQISRTWGTLAFVVYSPEEVPDLNVRRTGGTPNYTWGTGQQMVLNNQFRTLKSDSDLKVRQGYNIYVTELATYLGSKEDTNGDGTKDSYPLVWDTDGDGELDTTNQAKFLDFIRFTLTDAANDNDKPVYLLGIYGITGTMVTPVATPEIADGAEAVCNEVGTYRINFNSPIYPDATKKPAVVTANGAEIEGVTYTYGTDYVDLHLPTLALETKYTVSIQPNSILSYYTGGFYAPTSSETVDRQYVAATDFTFSTKDTDCKNATPVIKMTYPADGATCVANTGFAAKVVAGSSAITGIEFWKGETKLGDGIAMSDGEYWFQPTEAALTVGEASEITVKAVGTDVTASATYTGATTPEYDVKGIYNDRVFVMQEEPSATITVVNKAHKSLVPSYALADNIAKIEIYNKDNVLVDTVTGTNEYTLTFDEYFDNKVTIKVYDIYGNIHPFEYDYYVADGVKNIASYVQDFNNISAEATQDEIISTIARVDSNGAIKTSNSFAYTIENGALKITNNHATKAQSFQVKNTAPNTGHKVHYYEFYVTHSDVNTFSSSVRTSFGTGNTDSLLSTGGFFDNGTTKVRTLPANTKKKVNIIIDYNYEIGDAPTCVINWGGEEWKQVKLTGYASETVYVGQNFLELSCAKNGAWIMIDDFKYTVYDVRPEYEVKGLADGTRILDVMEPTRKITVVDKDSTTATNVEKVEIYNDDILLDTLTESPYEYTLTTEDKYFDNKLKVMVYDVYGGTHIEEIDYYVEKGILNETYCFEEDFEDFDPATTTSEQLAKLMVANDGQNMDATRLALSVDESKGSKALMISYTSSDTSKYPGLQFTGAPSETGSHMIHIYEFNAWMTKAYEHGFIMAGNSYEDTKNNSAVLFTNKDVYDNGANNVKVRVVLDYRTEGGKTPTATVYLKNQEFAKVDLTNVVAGTGESCFVLKFHYAGNPIYIDNFKYTVYDRLERFGKGDFDMNVTMGEPNLAGGYIPATVTTKFTNTTNETVTVRNFFAVYAGDGRLVNVYEGTHGNFKEGGNALELPYASGAIDQEQTYRVNVSREWGDDVYAKIFSFVKTAEGIDFAPIKDYE